ncbi:hypothetical protein D3A96_06775 [Robertkochia marina]|nr:hypothetical protein D3A96_06775 [Robertkochia marina]
MLVWRERIFAAGPNGYARLKALHSERPDGGLDVNQAEVRSMQQGRALRKQPVAVFSEPA